MWHNLTRENPRDLSQVIKVNISNSESCDGVPLIGYDKKVNSPLESGSPNPPPPPQSNRDITMRQTPVEGHPPQNGARVLPIVKDIEYKKSWR